jgi:hypothetical protein
VGSYVARPLASGKDGLVAGIARGSHKQDGGDAAYDLDEVRGFHEGAHGASSRFVMSSSSLHLAQYQWN